MTVPTYEQLVRDKIVLRRAALAVLDAVEEGRSLTAALERLEMATALTNDESRPVSLPEPLHVDRVALNPLGAPNNEHLLGRYPSKDDLRIGAQERDGRATYVYISDPHTMAECPFR